MTDKKIPDLFFERLKNILPAERLSEVVATFSGPRPVSLRVNTLKIAVAQARALLDGSGLSYRPVPWAEDVLVLGGENAGEVCRSRLGPYFEQGFFYRQGLASLLPVLVLDPQPGERVLDMCAAPGGKTSQMAARMRNQGEIVAVEAVRSRFYRLKAVLTLLGVQNVSGWLGDARRFRDREGFDKILVDAPCSSEARFDPGDPRTFAYWSPRKIKEMARKQRWLLRHAVRLLKPGGVLVYSTCTFAPEENEAVVDGVLRKAEVPLDVVEAPGIPLPTYPAVSAWAGKDFLGSVKNTLRVLPRDGVEGFFIAQIQHRGEEAGRARPFEEARQKR